MLPVTVANAVSLTHCVDVGVDVSVAVTGAAWDAKCLHTMLLVEAIAQQPNASLSPVQCKCLKIRFDVELL